MMRFTLFYGHPTDPAHFESYYLDTHMPIAEKIPHVKKVELVKCVPNADGSAPPHYRITELWFDTPEAMQAAFASPEAAAAVADIPNYATGGVTTTIGVVETRTYGA